MKTLQDYIDKLNSLNFKEMYNNDFFWTWDKTDDELEAVFTVADALRFMRENNISTKVFESGLGISIFRDNSTRTRFSFASACNLLGLEVQDLDEKKSQIAHGETVRETANMVSVMICISEKDMLTRKNSWKLLQKETKTVSLSRDLLL